MIWAMITMIEHKDHELYTERENNIQIDLFWKREMKRIVRIHEWLQNDSTNFNSCKASYLSSFLTI